MRLKLEKLYDLGRLRQAARWDGFLNLADFHGGGYESRFVSPFTKGASNTESNVFLVLQDWASDQFLERPFDEEIARHGRKPGLETNTNLERLLKDHFDLLLSEVFATNLFPLIKLGPMNAPIPAKVMVRAAHEFAFPQIEIVQPKLVVALGLKVFHGFQRACGIQVSRNAVQAISNPFDYLGVRYWCQAHPGKMGTNTRNRVGPGQTDRDWIEMRDWYDSV